MIAYAVFLTGDAEIVGVVTCAVVDVVCDTESLDFSHLLRKLAGGILARFVAVFVHVYLSPRPAGPFCHSACFMRFPANAAGLGLAATLAAAPARFRLGPLPALIRRILQCCAWRESP